MLRILRAADRRRIAWKNGGGEAEDIASAPADASWDAMDWRVSRAWIAASGPFSVFPGIDRTFLVVEGDGVELSPDGHPPVRLDPSSPPYAFPGDVATGCRLLGSPVTAFNVMSRRGRWRHDVARSALAGTTELPGAATATLAMVLRGAARLQAPDEGVLAAADAVLLAAGRAASLEATDGTLVLARLWAGGREA